MNSKKTIALICILCLLVCALTCGCKKKDDESTDTATDTYTYPPFHGAENTPDDDEIIIERETGEDGEIIPPYMTAQP